MSGIITNPPPMPDSDAQVPAIVPIVNADIVCLKFELVMVVVISLSPFDDEDLVWLLF